MRGALGDACRVAASLGDEKPPMKTIHDPDAPRRARAIVSAMPDDTLFAGSPLWGGVLIGVLLLAALF